MSRRLVCPFCEREFPRWYWYVPYCVGALGIRKNKGLAYANFRRHKVACKRKHVKEGENGRHLE